MPFVVKKKEKERELEKGDTAIPDSIRLAEKITSICKKLILLKLVYHFPKSFFCLIGGGGGRGHVCSMLCYAIEPGKCLQ